MTATLTYRWQRREASFFCIGMLLVPVFWVWWTLQSRFKPWQRVLAFGWTAAWLAYVVVRRHELVGEFFEVAAAFPWLCYAAGLLLSAWLLARIAGCISVLVLIDVVSVHASLMMVRFARGDILPFEPLVWVAVPAALHLVLTQSRSCMRKAGTR